MAALTNRGGARKEKNEYEFMYASARVRALENHLIGQEKLERLVECASAADVMNVLAEYGVKAEGQGADPVKDHNAREELLLNILRRAIEDLEEAGATPEILAVVRYPYDCNNVKAVLKSAARGVDPAPMCFDFGTAPVEQVMAIPARLQELRRDGAKPTLNLFGEPEAEAGVPKELAFLPTHMAIATVQAEKRFAETGNPQVVDLLLDRACFADMADAANASGCRLAREAVRARADLTNLMICVRLLRMRGADCEKTAGGRAFFEEAILPGGVLGPDFLLGAYDAGESALFEQLSRTPYDRFATAALATDGSLAAIERVADNEWMELVRPARYVSFGPDVLFAYLAANEYAVKNLRILLAGKDTGFSPDAIRERLRLSYV